MNRQHRSGSRSPICMPKWKTWLVTQTLLIMIVATITVRTSHVESGTDELEYSDSTNGLQQQPFTFTRLAPNKTTTSTTRVKPVLQKRSDFSDHLNSTDTFRPLRQFMSRRLTTAKVNQTVGSATPSGSLSIGELTLEPLPKSIAYHPPAKVAAQSIATIDSSNNSTGRLNQSDRISNLTINRTLPVELHLLDSQKWDASTSKPAFGSPTEQHSVMINHGGGAISTIRRSLLSNGPFVHHLQVGYPPAADHFAPIQFDQIDFNDDFTPPPPIRGPPTHQSPPPALPSPPVSINPSPPPLSAPPQSFRTGSTVKPILPLRHSTVAPKRVGYAAIQPEVNSRRLPPINRGHSNRAVDHSRSHSSSQPPPPPPPQQPSSPGPQSGRSNHGFQTMSNMATLRPADLPNYAELSFFGYSLDQSNHAGQPPQEFSNKDQYTHDQPIEALQRRPLFSERQTNPVRPVPIVPHRRPRDFEQFDKPPMNGFPFDRNVNAFQPAAPLPARHTTHHSNNNHNNNNLNHANNHNNNNNQPPANEFHLSNFFSRDNEDAQPPPPPPPPNELFSLFEQPPFNSNNNGYPLPFDNRFPPNQPNSFNVLPAGRGQLLQRRKLSTPSNGNGPLLNELSNNQLGYGYPNYNVYKGDDDLGAGKWPKIFKFTDGRVNLNDFEREKKLGKILFAKTNDDGEFFEHVRRDSFLILHGGSFQY
jgi:hypothetical protein